MELAQWLGREMGQTVGVVDVPQAWQGAKGVSEDALPLCLPLLGQLLRTDSRGARS